MTTTDDVFSLYAHLCSSQRCIGLEESSYASPLNPIEIGDVEVKCDLKRKCYIKAGDECPICMDPIFNKSNAYLTWCGHSFHKSCIFHYMETKWVTKYASNTHCPMCRKSLGMGLHAMNERYAIDYLKPNYLDILENFWLTKDYTVAHVCRNRYDHYLGMKKNCKLCRKFVVDGTNQ